MPSYSTNVTSTAGLLHTATRTPTVSEQVTFENFGTNVVYVSNNAGVTTTTGFPLSPQSTIEWIDASGSIYGITASGTSRVQTTANVR